MTKGNFELTVNSTGKSKDDVDYLDNAITVKRQGAGSSGGKFDLTTDDGAQDFDITVADVILKDGDKVKVSVRFRGREVTHASLGQDLLHRFAELCSECSTVEKQPKLEGRQMLMFLAPAKDK